MLDSIFLEITKAEPHCQKAACGVAFLNAAKNVYGLHSLSYLAINIPTKQADQLHVAHSDTSIRQKRTPSPLSVEVLNRLGLLAPGTTDWTRHPRLHIELRLRLDASETSELKVHSFPLASLGGETAIFAAAGVESACSPESMRECRILAQYFHSHILRVNGHDASESLIISARELDCLRWTAAGKTAWEASRILGISERTVRFHLNAAREKLRCATTTQAVAKAVAAHLIAP
jgi:DNA-binding CsgD family transcriptional regulator